jgi:4-amino-4-deoxy-L-arabinose transferase-like glycosyltransferase
VAVSEEPSNSARGRRLVAALLFVAAIVLGLPSLTFPFGSDQALYYYVAREWLLRGAVPYLHTFDHKTPGIYLLHAAVIALFGENMWGIRVADLACTLVLGALAAHLVTPTGSRPRADLVGLGSLCAAIFYYGLYDFWDTAQSELWYATLAFGALCAARRVKDLRRAAIVTGALSGAAIVMKPPAAMLVAVAVVALLARARAPRLLGWLAVGLAGVVTPLFAYFWAKGALPAMFDIVVGANAYYVEHERTVHGATQAWGVIWSFTEDLFPLSLVAPIALALAVKDRYQGRSPSPSLVLGLATLLAAVLAVSVQLKFFALHFVVTSAPLALLVLAVAQRLRASPLASGCVLLFAFSATPAARGNWLHGAQVAYLAGTGKRSHAWWADRHRAPELGYAWSDVEATGLWLAEHAAPEDRVVVRGFNPGVYAVSKMRYGGRFFWSNFLVDPRRAYRRDDYMAEELDAFARIAPRYVVALTAARGSIDAADFYQARGYEVRKAIGGLEILERTEVAR